MYVSRKKSASYDDACIIYETNGQITFNTITLNLSFSNYCDSFIIGKGTI